MALPPRVPRTRRAAQGPLGQGLPVCSLSRRHLQTLAVPSWVSQKQGDQILEMG
jgi:hypothetical protein